MKKLLLLLCLLFSISGVYSKTITDEETWLNLNMFVKLTENWKLYAEYQPRWFDYERYSGAVLHRGAIGRNIGNGFSAWGGYGLITWNARDNSKFPAKTQHEDRLFLMLMHDGFDLGSWRITNRTRYEFRMFRHDAEASERFRHMIRGVHKFGNGPWAIALWDEYFWNTNTIHPSQTSHAPVIQAGFDQNRAFIGGAYYFGEEQQHMIETGYMNNYVNGPVNDRNAHVWMTTVTGRF